MNHGYLWTLIIQIHNIISSIVLKLSTYIINQQKIKLQKCPPLEASLTISYYALKEV